MKLTFGVSSKRALSLMAGIMLIGSAAAHHSYAMFDKRQVVIKGTIKEFRWTNPHIFITLLAPNGKGGTTLWGAEGSGLGDLARNGWKFNSLQAGDAVTIGIAPLRDGRNGGGLIFVQKADGTRLSGGPLDRLLNHVGGPPGGPNGPGGPKPPGAPNGQG